jgi:hypothetical protein
MYKDLKEFEDWLRKNKGTDRPSEWYDVALDALQEYKEYYLPPIKGFLRWVDDTIEGIAWEYNVETHIKNRIRSELCQVMQGEMDKYFDTPEEQALASERKDEHTRYSKVHTLLLLYKGKL